jgi:hypothetical protein
MKCLYQIILLLLVLSTSSCNSFFNRGSLYVPVKSNDLKYNKNYKAIKELDSLEYKPKIKPSNTVKRDSILKRNQKIVDQINEINVSLDSNFTLKNENKLYTLQEINYGKFVKTYYKRDLRKNYIAYTKKKLSAVEMILYGIGLYFIIGLLTAVISAIAVILLLLLFTGSAN